MKAKWIVVIVEAYYPSVYHFDNEKEARDKYEDCRECGFVTHLAEVKEQSINPEEMKGYGRDSNKIEDLDVEW